MVQEERIPESVLHQIQQLKELGLPSHKAISLVRSNLVAVGHCLMPFQANVPETEITTMRSLVATLYFRHDVATWKRKWADFSLYMYIPEVDPTTGKVHHEREDHCHILKRIAKHTREGAYMKLNLDAFDEAMRDPKIGLTHTALVGKRKQSVTDAEKLLSFHVSHFLKEKGYLAEAKYVENVAKCH